MKQWNICFFFVHRYLMKIDNLRENNFPVLVESSVHET